MSQWATKRWLIIGRVSLTGWLFQGRRNGVSEPSPEQRETIYLALLCSPLCIGKCPLMTELLIYTTLEARLCVQYCVVLVLCGIGIVWCVVFTLKTVRCHNQEEEGQGNLKNPTMLITQYSKHLSSVLNLWTDFNIHLCFTFAVWFNRYTIWD